MSQCSSTNAQSPSNWMGWHPDFATNSNVLRRRFDAVLVALGRWLAQAKFVFEYRSSEASGPAADREEYREGFFLWHDAIWNKINLRNDRQSCQDGLFRVELPTFDEVSVRESLLNAVAHRDYRLGGSVFVRQYRQRLEAVSLGGLPAGITPANILDQQTLRNRRLAEALPSFAGTSAHEVRLTLHGAVAPRRGSGGLQHRGTIAVRAAIGSCQNFFKSMFLRYFLCDSIATEGPLVAIQKQSAGNYQPSPDNGTPG